VYKKIAGQGQAVRQAHHPGCALPAWHAKQGTYIEKQELMPCKLDEMTHLSQFLFIMRPWLHLLAE